MAERLVTLPGKQAAQVRFPVRARPTFSVEEVALFCNPASGGTFSCTAIEIIKWAKKNCSSASEGDPHLEAWGAIHQLLNIILKLRILVLLPVSTLPYVVKVKNYSLIGE
jgi:hypothetical protein